MDIMKLVFTTFCIFILNFSFSTNNFFWDMFIGLKILLIALFGLLYWGWPYILAIIVFIIIVTVFLTYRKKIKKFFTSKNNDS